VKRLLTAELVRTARGVSGDAILIDGESVVAVGRAGDLRSSDVVETSYPGAVIIPGLRDAHFHPVPYAAAISGTTLKTATDLAEVVVRLRAGAAALAPGAPLVALRLDDETLAERRLPTRDDLDAAIPDHPVLAHRYCGHVAVANSPALAAGGIGRNTPNPPGGVIDRDAAGDPTGILRETAIELVSTALASTQAVGPDQVVDAMHRLAGLGITSLGAMTRTGDGPWASLGNEAELLAEVADRLPITVHTYVIANSVDEFAAASRNLRAAGGRLRWAGLKQFADGSLGGHTAAMHEPFSDRLDATGTLRLTALHAELARACVAAGGSVALHAIGDLACGRVIDLFTELINEGADPRRLRLEHASVLTAADVTRLAALGVIACVQPAFLGSETEWLEKRLGPERLKLAYPFETMRRAGVRLAGGSDCPVEPPDPWAGMALARDRAGLVPQEGLSAAAALDLFTDGAALALGEPEPLAIGSPADVAVVDRDPVTVNPGDLRATEVLATWVYGAEVEFDRSLPAWND
jgi:predicted amidohydrolase YtcJ